MTERFDWWWSRIKTNEDFNSMPDDMKKDIIKKLSLCFVDLNNLQIFEAELLPLIEMAGIPTVFDAILVFWTVPNKSQMSRESAISYLRKVVYNSYKGRQLIPPTLHKEKKRKDKKEVSLDTAKKYHPLFRRKCGRG